MPLTEAQKRANAKYVKKSYDQIALIVPKGDKETIKVHASYFDKSLNSFINRAIKETLEHDHKI